MFFGAAQDFFRGTSNGTFCHASCASRMACGGLQARTLHWRAAYLLRCEQRREPIDLFACSALAACFRSRHVRQVARRYCRIRSPTQFKRAQVHAAAISCAPVHQGIAPTAQDFCPAVDMTSEAGRESGPVYNLHATRKTHGPARRCVNRAPRPTGEDT